MKLYSSVRAGRTLTFAVLSILFLNQPTVGFVIMPAQPGATTSYRATDVYTLDGGGQRSVFLNPAGVEPLILGGTDTFLATLTGEFPGWTFNTAASDLMGSFNIQNYYACGPGTMDCGTERAIPSTVVGSFIDITYTPGAGDPTAAGNDLHWIQRIFNNHASGSPHGVNDDKIDNDSGASEPDLGVCGDNPYYDCGYFAGETFFVDLPNRPGDPENDHAWGAEVYLVEQTAADTVTIYNGVRWGWGNTDSDVRALTAPPSAVTFDNPSPAVPPAVATGIGTNSITWGTAVDGSFESSLSITPVAMDLTPLIGEPFLLGTITYSNGTIELGSGLTSIEMSLETVIDVAALDITDLTIDDSRLTSMINTPNTCDADVPGDCTVAEARESADYVSIPPAADLSDIPAEFPNFSELGNNFHVLEESSATATLIGRITEAKITAGAGGNGVMPPGPDAPSPGMLAPRQNFVWEILGFGAILEGDGFITRGVPAASGDLNGDDTITPGDIDILTGGIRGGGILSASFDIDGSGTVNNNDLRTLVEVRLKTRFGDTDLDRDVDLDDGVRLINAFGKTDVGWGSGNLNTDNEVNLDDGIILVNNFGFVGNEPDGGDVVAQAVAPGTAMAEIGGDGESILLDANSIAVYKFFIGDGERNPVAGTDALFFDEGRTEFEPARGPIDAIAGTTKQNRVDGTEENFGELMLSNDITTTTDLDQTVSELIDTGVNVGITDRPGPRLWLEYSVLGAGESRFQFVAFVIPEPPCLCLAVFGLLAFAAIRRHPLKF